MAWKSITGISGNTSLSNKKREMEGKRPVLFCPDFGPEFCENMVFCTAMAIV